MRFSVDTNGYIGYNPNGEFSVTGELERALLRVIEAQKRNPRPWAPYTDEIQLCDSRAVIIALDKFNSNAIVTIRVGTDDGPVIPGYTDKNLIIAVAYDDNTAEHIMHYLRSHKSLVQLLRNLHNEDANLRQKQQELQIETQKMLGSAVGLLEDFKP